MPPSAEARDAAELVRRANVLLPGVYAWSATVLQPVTQRGVALAPRLGAALALAALVAGGVVGPRSPRLGRALGLHAFVGVSVGVWLLLDEVVSAERLEPVKAALGGLGWGLFAAGWGSTRELSAVPEDDPRALPGERLSPRGTLPRGALPVLGLALLGALATLALAWRVTRVPHALLAQAIGLACALALVSAGAEVAVGRGRWMSPGRASSRLGHAMVPLAALVIVLVVGALHLLGS